jgi:hypothetical protein
MVDTHALGACAFGRGGSSPLSRTMTSFRIQQKRFEHEALLLYQVLCNLMP